MKKIFTIALLFFLVGCSVIDSNSNIITNFQDVNDNPKKYLNKPMYIMGKMGVEVVDYVGAINFLYDDNGLRIYIQNKYKRTWTKGDTFTISGIFKYDSDSNLYYLEEKSEDEIQTIIGEEEKQKELINKINTDPEIDLNYLDDCFEIAQKGSNLDITKYKIIKCKMNNNNLEVDFEII